MKYENVKKGIFIDRPNRFIANVEIEGKTEVVHVKNTGRCRELLIPGVKVWVQEFENTNRKTKYDLLGVCKGNELYRCCSCKRSDLLPEDGLQCGVHLVRNRPVRQQVCHRHASALPFEGGRGTLREEPDRLLRHALQA